MNMKQLLTNIPCPRKIATVRRRILFLLLLSLSWVPAERFTFGQTQQSSTELRRRQSIEREMKGGETHSYVVKMRQGDFMYVEVDQRGIDVVVSLFAPDGKKLVEMNNRDVDYEQGPLSFKAPTDGDYQLRLSAASVAGTSGRYNLQLDVRSPLAQALPSLRRHFRDPSEEASTLQALPLKRAVGDRGGEANRLNNIGMGSKLGGKKEQALDYYKRALRLNRDAGDRSGEAAVLNNIGNVYNSLGEKPMALKFYKQALLLERAVGDRSREAAIARNIGVVYWSLGKNQKSLHYYNRAMRLEHAVGDRAGEALTLNNIGVVYNDLGKKRKALDYFNQALRLERAVGDRAGEALTLNNIGALYNDLGKKLKALDYYYQALPLERAVGDRAGEALMLGNFMQLWSELNRPALAIFYGKQAINIYQQLRSNIQGLEKGIQQTYLHSIEDSYRKLADLLISVGRVPEAEQVLSMLKEEEFFQYVRRDSREIEKLSKRVGLRNDERAALERYNTLAGKITAVGLALTGLEDKKNRLPPGAPFPEQTRYNELKQQLDDANKAFRLFLEKELVAEVGRAAKKEIEVDRALQGKLQQWGAGTVALYTILGEDRYRVILTTAKTQTDGKAEIKATDLNQKIFAFREALQNPRIDPRPLGKELYDILVKPIENDLKGALAQTLVWSLDGTLRYIPLAALWDGEHYLAEKYRIVVVTSTTRESLKETVDPNWRVLGLGVTKESKVIEPFGKTLVSFDALPGVDKELHAIVNSEDSKPREESGVLNGKRLVDDEFTAVEMENRLGRREGEKRKYNVIHFATHFRLGGDTATSFLLLGNNQAMTLEQVSDSTEMNFTDVELVTLSACNTGYGSVAERKIEEKEKEQFLKNNGREVDSLAAFIEGRGTKAVLATLWPVADESTQLLMAEFYRLRKENPNMTKAEAMQRAQVELLTGKVTRLSDTKSKRAEIAGVSSQDVANQPRFTPDPKTPYAHPYYWAPFILIGNWR